MPGTARTGMSGPFRRTRHPTWGGVVAEGAHQSPWSNRFAPGAARRVGRRVLLGWGGR